MNRFLDLIKIRKRNPFLFWSWVSGFYLLILLTLSFTSCQKTTPASEIPQVSVITIAPKDTPVTIEFVGQTQSAHQVEIRARVNGFLDKRSYVEGRFVHAGDVMFLMDPKPFQAQLDAQKGALAEQQARLQTAEANLTRVKPLVKLNALSQKDLDEATGQYQAAKAAVEAAKANVVEAELNLGYTTISSPISGLSSYARVQDGTYINPQNNLLTYVAATDPIWVNFSVSENDVLKYRGQSEKGVYLPPKDDSYVVKVILADGTIYPEKGSISFADAEYNSQTGTFLVRATFPNPNDLLRPGQFLRVQLHGGIRPKATLVPQQAVFEGAHGNFVWIVDKESKAQIRDVEIGPLQGEQWFIDKGLQKGDVVIVEGMMKLNAGSLVKAVPYQGKNEGKDSKK